SGCTLIAYREFESLPLRSLYIRAHELERGKNCSLPIAARRTGACAPRPSLQPDRYTVSRRGLDPAPDRPSYCGLPPECVRSDEVDPNRGSSYAETVRSGRLGKDEGLPGRHCSLPRDYFRRAGTNGEFARHRNGTRTFSNRASSGERDDDAAKPARSIFGTWTSSCGADPLVAK